MPKRLRSLQPGIEPGTALVPLTRGKFAVIDEVDAEEVGKYNWYYARRHTCEYAQRFAGKGQVPTVVRLHTLLMGRPPSGFEIDHIDRNGLNNRRNNLRVVTHAVNMQNRSNCGGQTGITGVYREEGGYCAQLRKNGRLYRKRCRSLDEAIKHRNSFCEMAAAP